MKKFFPILLVLFAAFAATMMVSCSSDDDDDKVQEQEVSLSLEPNADLLDVLDLSVIYTDENGKTQTETVTDKYYKSFTVSKYPSSGSFSLKATAKTSFGKDHYTPNLKFEYRADSHQESATITSIGSIYTTTDLQKFVDQVNKYKWTWNFLSGGSQKK